jgi:HAE1 family hydrophobic/amphiphilic exporter-1
VIRHAIERPVSTLVAALTLVVLGGFSLLRLPVALLPSVERPRLVVTVEAADASRDQMLHQVTEPLERTFLALAGVTSVVSETGEGLTRVILETRWQTDADRLRIEAERRLAALPSSAYDTLSVEMEVGDPSPMVEVAVLGGTAAARAAFSEEVLLPEMARLPGAGRAELVGRRPLHVTVEPRGAALAARGLTAEAVRARLEFVGRPVAAGRAREGGVTRPLVVREAVTSLEQLARVQIGNTPLGEVAALGVEEARDGSWFQRDGEPGVLLRLYRAPGANAVALARAASERVEALAVRAPGGLEITLVRDRSREVVSALGQLALAAVAGFGLGTVVLRWMLGRWRPTLALAVVIPASVVVAFAAFYLWDISLDVVSLAGLALAAGMLVDNSVVVLEAIETSRERGEARPAVAGTQGIAMAVVASFLTTAVVFLPLIYLQGLARAFFGVQAFAIVTSLFASLLLSLTVTPVLSGGRRRRDGETPPSGASPGRRPYLRLLEGTLARPWPVLLLGVLLIAGGVLLGWRLPRELMPDAPPRQLDVAFRLPPGLTPEAAEQRGMALAAAVERALERAGLATAERSTLAYRIAPAAQRGTAAAEGIDGHIELLFRDPEAAARALPVLAPAVTRVPGIEAIAQPRTSAFVEVLEEARQRVEIVATAATQEEVTALAKRTAAAVGAAVGSTPALDARQRPRPALALTWDHPRLARLGARPGPLESQLRAAAREDTAGRVEIPGLESEIRIVPTVPTAVELLPVQLPGGDPSSVVPLSSLARVRGEWRAPLLERIDGRPALRLHLEVPRLDGALVATLNTTLAQTAQAAEGGNLRLGGSALELQSSFGQLRLALALAVVLVFLTLAALYESLSLPWVVMSSVPAAAAGAAAALALGGQSLNVMSFLGVILLTGIVVNNAIVLVHRVEQHREGAGTIIDAVRRAAAERYRPIVMTTLTTLLGMLPLALLGGEGLELRRALSVAVLGGLVTSTFASLFLVPALYAVMRRREPTP